MLNYILPSCPDHRSALFYHLTNARVILPIHVQLDSVSCYGFLVLPGVRFPVVLQILDNFVDVLDVDLPLPIVRMIGCDTEQLTI